MTLDELKATYGRSFDELLLLFDRLDALASELVKQDLCAATVLSSEGKEHSERAALGLLQFLTNNYAVRAGIQGGVAGINFGVPPSLVYWMIQQASHLGLAQAV